MPIAKRLRAAIKRSDKSIGELADALGLHRVTLSRFANGHIDLPTEKAEELAKLLNLKVNVTKG